LGGVFGFKAVEHLFGGAGGAARPACRDFSSQRFQFKLVALFAFFQQTQSGADNFTEVVEATTPHLIVDENFKMAAEGDTGRHVILLSVNNSYFISAFIFVKR
jgi:hypothetical protein